MAETEEKNVLAEVESGEKFLRREEEVVDLPPNVQNLQISWNAYAGRSLLCKPALIVCGKS